VLEPDFKLFKFGTIEKTLFLEFATAQLGLLLLSLYRIEPSLSQLIQLSANRACPLISCFLVSSLSSAESGTERVSALLVKVYDGIEREDQMLAGP
jgi:hypothetical protein